MYFHLPPADLGAIQEKTQGVWDELRGKRIFMTGGTGFFGRWLLGSLLWANKHLDAQIEAVVMSRDPAKFLSHFPGMTDTRLSFHVGDVRYSIFPPGEFSHILHLSTDSKFDDPSEHLQIMDGIVGGTRRMLDFAVHRAKAQRFLYVSSGAVYAPQSSDPSAIAEDFLSAPLPMNPRSLIGNAKRIAEQMCTLYHQQFGMETTIARCFTFVGPHMPMDSYFALGNFIRDASNGADTIRVAGDGMPIRSYLYAADLTIWLWHILINGKPNCCYNVGSDQSLTIKELAYLVQEIAAPEKPVIIAGENKKNSGLSFYYPSIQRVREELGLEVWTPLTEAIARTAEWYRQDMQRNKSRVPTSAQVKNKVFVVDIDGVLAGITDKNDYALAQPLSHTIHTINRLYNAGHRIVLFTARGSVTGLDWRDVTEQQMHAWGVKYHELHFGKPAADYYVDDRMIPLEMLDQMAAGS